MDRELAFLRDLGLGEVAERPPEVHGASGRSRVAEPIRIAEGPFHAHPSMWKWPACADLDFGPPEPVPIGVDLLEVIRKEQVVLVLHDGRAHESYLHRVDAEAEGRMARTQYRPGCWLGVMELLRTAIRERYLAATPEAAVRLDETLESHRARKVVALGRFDRRAPSPTQVHKLPFAWFLERLKHRSPLRTWLGDQFACRYLFRDRLLRHIDAHPMLRNLAAADREYLLQLGSLARAPTWDTRDESPVYQEAGKPPDRAALILSGDARLYAPPVATDAGERRDVATGFLGRLGPGSLLGDEDLVLPHDLQGLTPKVAHTADPDASGAPGPRRTEIRLSPDSFIVEFDWRALRRTLADSWEHWLPALRYVSRDSERVASTQAPVVMVSSHCRGLGVTTVARGVAYALAAGRWAEVARPPEHGEVWLVELDCDSVEWPHRGVNWRPIEVDDLAVWKPRRPDDPGLTPSHASKRSVNLATLDEALHTCPLLNDTHVDGLRVIRVPGQQGEGGPTDEAYIDAERLVSVLRARADTRFVVVSRALPMPKFIVQPLQPGEQPRKAPLEQWMSCEGLTLLWLHDNPEAPFPEGFEFSRRVVQVDRVNDRYREIARGLSHNPAMLWRRGKAKDHVRPPANGIVRLLDDAAGADMLARGEFEQAVTGAHPMARAVRRLARAVVGRTIGVALGGGGVWGSAHFAVIEQLLGGKSGAAPFPIDYIAGTSFGAVVGGLYAAGGLAAARAFVAQESVAPGMFRSLRGMIRSPMFRATLVESVFSTRPLQRMVDDVLRRGFVEHGENNLLCTEIPFFPVATLIDQGRSFAPQHGSVGFGVRAAGSLPPVGPPMRRGKDLVTDGAFVENVPAEMVRNRGADFVICANVIGPPASPLSQSLGCVPPVAMVFDATVGRMLTLYRGNMLSQWMIGESQGRLQADLRLDLRTADVPVYAGWMAEDLWRSFGNELEANNFRSRVAELYGRDRAHRKCERLLIELGSDGKPTKAERS